MPNYRYFAGSFCDTCATSTGYAFARVDGRTLIVSAGVSGQLPSEVWRATPSEPIVDLRIACNVATDEIRVIAKGTRTNTARYFTSTTETSKGAAYGECPVLLQYNADWIGYIARTAKTYTRWPFAGAEPAASVNPFTVAGSNLGMIQVISSTVTWRELTPQTAATVGQLKRTSLGGVLFYVPMVLGGVTVGQAEGPPTNTDQIIAAHSSIASSILPIKGYNPHVAILADGSFVFAGRTLATELAGPQPARTSGMGSAALVFAPPWPDYHADAAITPTTLYPPWQQGVNQPQVLDKGGRMSMPWQRYLQRVDDRATNPVVLGSVNVSGGGGGLPPGPPPPLTQDADVGVGADGTGFPNARVFTNTATVTWDIGTANQVKANATGGSGLASIFAVASYRA